VLQENKQLARNLTESAKKAVRKINAPKQDALRLARKTHGEQESIAQRILGGREPTIVDAIREFTRDKLRANLEDIETQNVKEIAGVYDVIVIDAPWDQGLFVLDATPESVGLNYPTMSEEQLLALKIPAANDCHLWLWTTHRFLPSALRLLEAWGFKYICTFVWHKRTGFQPLHLPKYNCEFSLYARKGNPQFVDTKSFFTCFEAPTREHSEKPEEFYEMVRRVTAGRRLDMFSRRKIEGFDGWGNEAE
jgi:N6-adenosine-specific RNA methylase IME4